MPQRFLKPGITNSERWNRVSWSAQSLYIRLLTVVDDYGRFDGRAAVIHGQCFSLYNAINPEHPVKLQETDKMLQEIAASGLVELYDAQGKRVMQITQWTERLREGVKEKWPARNNGELLQLPAETCKNLPSPSSSSSASASSPPSTPLVLEVECIETRRVESDTQWLELLQKSEGYRELNVKEQYSRCDIWCQEHRKKLTKRRFIAWLNKADKPLAVNGNGHHAPNGAQIIAWNQELGRVITKMDRIAGQYGDHQGWDQRDRTRYSELLERKKQLKELIGVKE